MCKNVDVVFRHDSGGANVLAALVVKQGVDRDSCIFAMTQFLPFFFFVWPFWFLSHYMFPILFCMYFSFIQFTSTVMDQKRRREEMDRMLHELISIQGYCNSDRINKMMCGSFQTL